MFASVLQIFTFVLLKFVYFVAPEDHCSNILHHSRGARKGREEINGFLLLLVPASVPSSHL